MTKQDITIRVLTLLDQFVEPGIEVTPSTYFYDLGFDSLDRIEILASCEKQFGINISDRYKPQEIETVAQLINLIYTYLNEPST